MFEEMGKTRAVIAFVSRTDIVVNSDGYDRNRIIRIKNDSKAVREAVFLNFERRQFECF